MTPFLMAVCLLAGVLIGLRVNARRVAALREQLRLRNERHDAWNLSAQRTDLAEIGPVTPPRGVDEMDVPGFMADSGYRPPLATGGLVALSNPPVVVSEGLCTLPSPHHLGPCGWSNGDTVCGDPSAGTVTWPGQGPVDLCDTHISWAREEIER